MSLRILHCSPRLRELGYDIHYIGSYNGIEKELIEPFGIPYHGISSGKLRPLLQRTELYGSRSVF